MIHKIVHDLSKAKQQQRESALVRKLMRQEAKIGGELFGPLPEGHRREFFCLDKDTWVWHEEWNDENGERKIMTTRYDVRPKQILKSQNGVYSEVQEPEARKLQQAARLYEQRVKAEIYKDIQTV